jgi:hypothetical protein
MRFTLDVLRFSLLSFFEVLQPRIEYFLDPAKFGSPKIAHFVEAPVNGIEALVDRGEALIDSVETLGKNAVLAIELSIDVRDYQADEDRVEEHRRADDEVKLLVGHCASPPRDAGPVK